MSLLKGGRVNLMWPHRDGLSWLRLFRLERHWVTIDSVLIGDDGWPLRAGVEAVWREVIAGQRTRESAHDWSVPWVEGDAAHSRPKDSMVIGGLQHLHGLDMTAMPGTPNLISHGGPGSYVLSADEVAAGLGHWLGQCREYDDDPEGFVQRARERARQYIARDQARRSI